MYARAASQDPSSIRAGSSCTAAPTTRRRPCARAHSRGNHMNAPERTGVAALLGRPYKTIRLEWSSDLAMLRVRTCVKPIQCYSLAAMSELQQMLSDIAANPGLVRHFVMTSDVPRVFNFGGD